MTDNEIIKALECCQTEYERKCEECPYDKFKSHSISVVSCESRLREDLLHFVNRQKAEIEEQDSEIARLKGILDCYARQYGTVRCYTEGKDED